MRFTDHFTILGVIRALTIMLVLAAIVLAYTGNADGEAIETIERNVRSASAASSG
jgi:hypothetical protein